MTYIVYLQNEKKKKLTNKNLFKRKKKKKKTKWNIIMLERVTFTILDLLCLLNRKLRTNRGI